MWENVAHSSHQRNRFSKIPTAAGSQSLGTGKRSVSQFWFKDKTNIARLGGNFCKDAICQLIGMDITRPYYGVIDKNLCSNANQLLPRLGYLIAAATRCDLKCANLQTWLKNQFIQHVLKKTSSFSTYLNNQFIQHVLKKSVHPARTLKSKALQATTCNQALPSIHSSCA